MHTLIVTKILSINIHISGYENVNSICNKSHESPLEKFRKILNIIEVEFTPGTESLN